MLNASSLFVNLENVPIAVIEAESRLDIVSKQCIYSSGLSSRTVGT